MAPDSLKRISQNTVVILGDFIHEGLRATIAGLGYTYIQRTLYNRKPKTWKKRAETISQLQKSGHLAGVILYLPTPVFVYGCHPDFAEAWADLVEELSRHKSIAFVFENNLAGEFGFWDYESEQSLDYEEAQAEYERLKPFLGDSTSEGRKAEQLMFAIQRMEQVQEMSPEIDSFLRTLLASSVEVAPFRSRADVTIRIREFLEHIDGGVFLRLYVPNGRYQSQQLDSFLRIFESYLRQVEGINFSIDSGKTEHGVVYTFRSPDTLQNGRDFQDALTRFDDFMNLCRYEPQRAETILQHLGVDSTEASYVVTRYSKNYQRIVMDARHELEYKKLVLRQKLESEVFEIASGDLLPTPLPEHISPFVSLSHNIGPIMINLPQVSVRNTTAIQSIVGQVVHGDITYNEEDRQLATLFNQYASQLEAIQLQSDLEQLKDESTPQSGKQTAKQRLLAFLYRTAETAGDAAVKIATSVLVEYLKNLSTGSP
jgi:hypothetical protein